MEDKGTFLDARWIPEPKWISPEARAHLRLFRGPDGRPLRSAPTYPAVDDDAAWEALKAQVNAQVEMGMAQKPEPAAACETVDIDGVQVHVATPREGFVRRDCAYMDMHGGALVFCEGPYSRDGARRQADLYGVRVYGVDYRNPPAHPYPAALDDCMAVYRALLRVYSPENIIVGGASGGSNLAAATVLRARDEGLPLPGAVVLQAPEVDLTESGDSFSTVDGLDMSYPVSLMPINLLYAAGHDLTDPYLSPIYGDFTKGFPPTFLHSGTRDFFLSNTVVMHRALRRAGVEAELHIFEAMPHGGFHGAPEDLEVMEEVRRFVAKHWGAPREPVTDDLARTLRQ